MVNGIYFGVDYSFKFGLVPKALHSRNVSLHASALCSNTSTAALVTSSRWQTTLYKLQSVNFNSPSTAFTIQSAKDVKLAINASIIWNLSGWEWKAASEYCCLHQSHWQSHLTYGTYIIILTWNLHYNIVLTNQMCLKRLLHEPLLCKWLLKVDQNNSIRTE